MTTTSKEFDVYMKDHKLEGLFDKLTEELLKSQPEKPLQFLIDKLKIYQGSGFPYERRKIIFVLGGPGSGKGTQCSRLVDNYGMVHFSAGDLLRAEAKKDTEVGKMIASMIKEGAIVPGHVTITLLKEAITSHPNKDAYFLIDGFPREMKQAIDFERSICPCQFVLFFDCPEEVLEKRLLERGKSSGRSDDNIESIKKRFRTYNQQTMPVIEYFSALSKVRTVDSSNTINEVFEQAKKYFIDHDKDFEKNHKKTDEED